MMSNSLIRTSSVPRSLFFVTCFEKTSRISGSRSPNESSFKYEETLSCKYHSDKWLPAISRLMPAEFYNVDPHPPCSFMALSALLPVNHLLHVPTWGGGGGGGTPYLVKLQYKNKLTGKLLTIIEDKINFMAVENHPQESQLSSWVMNKK